MCGVRRTTWKRLYGPCECSMMVSCKLLPAARAGMIGYPQGGNTLIVDESYDRLSPIGTLGELLYEGPMLAKGYFINKALTEAALIHNLIFGVLR